MKAAPNKKKGEYMAEFYFIRHGEADYSEKNTKFYRNQGTFMCTLTEKGVEFGIFYGGDANTLHQNKGFDMKVAEYMEDHIGEEFEGVIDTITNFGFFVELPNLVEGLVHVQTLKGDYFTYIPELLSMIGKSTKKTYRLGDKVRVKCVAASKETSMVDFELVKVDENGNKKQES